jgi:GNAT superfamily N-acetyltransferase
VQATVRDATPADWTTLLTIAAEGGSPDADAAHLDFVAATGRLLVAHGPGEPLGFAGVLHVHDATMVTDLFVAASHRGLGIGGSLLRQVLAGAERAFTFASADPAALSAYLRSGMQVQWPLLTVRGVAIGGGELPSRPWRGTPDHVVQHLLEGGAISTGAALVSVHEGAAHVHRLCSDAAVAPAVLNEVLFGLPTGTEVEVSVPSGSALLAPLVARGFRIADIDIHCATPGFVLPHGLAAVHRGLC